MERSLFTGRPCSSSNGLLDQPRRDLPARPVGPSERSENGPSVRPCGRAFTVGLVGERDVDLQRVKAAGCGGALCAAGSWAAMAVALADKALA